MQKARTIQYVLLVITALLINGGRAHAENRRIIGSHSTILPTRIMPLGDSLTAGAYIDNGRFLTGAGYRHVLWDDLLSAGYFIQFVGAFENGPIGLWDHHHEGHSGRRIDEIAEGAASWVANARPDVVLLLIGTNDAIQSHQNNDMNDAVKRLSNLVDVIEGAAPQAKIIVSTIIPNAYPEIESRVETYNATLTSWVNTRKVSDEALEFVDMYHLSRIHNGADGHTSDLYDKVHPTSHGYEAMGHVWFEALQKVLAPPPFKGNPYNIDSMNDLYVLFSSFRFIR